jgi:hypothetical protein
MTGINKPVNRFAQAANFAQETTPENQAPAEVAASPEKAKTTTKKADKTEKRKTTQQIRTERGLLRLGVEVDEATRDKVALTVLQNKRFKNKRDFVLRCVQYGLKHPEKI